MSPSECWYTALAASIEQTPSVIIPVFPLPNIINSLAFADKIILSELTINWSPVKLPDDGYPENAVFDLAIVSLNGTFIFPDVK